MTGVLGAVTSGARTFWAALNRYLDADGMRQGAAVSLCAAFSMAPPLVVATRAMVWLGRPNQAVTPQSSAIGEAAVG